MRVVVVGGGVAGMAVALELADRGHTVRLLERRPFLGGRVFSFQERRGGLALDNGQHALLGCYEATLAFLRRIGSADLLYWHGLRMEMREPGRRGVLDAGRTPAPLHLSRALLRYSLLSSVEKARAVGGASVLMARWKAAPDGFASRTVRDVLRSMGQTEPLCRRLWDPIAIAALNADPAEASAALFAAVLERAFFGRTQDASIVLPAVPLGEVFGGPGERALRAAGVDVLAGTSLTGVNGDPHLGAAAVETSDGRTFEADAIVLAVPPTALRRVRFGNETACEALGPWVDVLGETMPIVSTHVALEQPVSLPAMTGLLGTATQWVFHTNRFRRDATESTLLSCVVSAAANLDGRDDRDIARETAADLERLCPEIGRVAPESVHVVREKHATIAATPAATQVRPPVHTNVPGVFLAGDWVDTGLPATIESAAVSARDAAAAVAAFRPPEIARRSRGVAA